MILALFYALKEDLTMKAIGYIRESTKDQAEFGYNIHDQERKIRTYFQYIALDNPDATLEIVNDGGFSAKSLKRPGIKNVISMIENRKIDTIIIHNLDRLTRNITDLATIIELCDKYNVSLISLTEKLDTSSAAGKFFVYMLGLIAQWERETISERTKRSYDEIRRQKKFPHSSRVVYPGYKIDENRNLIIEPKGAKIIKELFELAATGEYNFDELAKIMKKRGYKRFVRDDVISKIISNTVYIGKYEGETYKGEKLIVEDYCPAIIPLKLFKQANDAVSVIKRPKRTIYVFHGKVWCGKCGKPLIQTIANGRTFQYKYYYCKYCRKRIDERFIIDEVSNILENANKTSYSADVRYRFQKKIKMLKKVKRIIEKELTLASKDIEKSEVSDIKESILKQVDEAIQSFSVVKTYKIEENIRFLSVEPIVQKEVFLKYFDKVVVYLNRNSKDSVIVPILKKKINESL